MKWHAQMAYALLLFQAAAVASETTQENYTIIEDKAAVLPILTPALSERKTLKLRLDNGLEAYLISDPGLDQSAAALSVRAGSWNDPEEYPGMAHFCEHLLFMGNAAYPKEFEYMQFIADHGGTVNAATYSDHTTYYFSINNEAYFNALDRFSHFFIDPLFARSGIDRELHAVDQEHAKNIEHDGWRQYMVFKETANVAHPIVKFSTGNAKTLSGIPTDVVKQWYKDHYSANQMLLLAISPTPLEELTDYVIQYFSKVPVATHPTEELKETMTSDNQRGHITYIKPIKDLKVLSLQWEVSEEFAQDTDRGALSLIGYALSNKDENSLLAQLKRENIAEALSVSQDRLGKKELLFGIDISLTEQGLSQIDTAIERTFQAIAQLKKTGISPSLFEELRTIANLNYQYQSREDAFEFVMDHAFSMLYEDLYTFPLKSSTYTTYDAAFNNAFLETLTPQTCLFSVIADPTLVHVTPDKKEKWMDVEYTIKEVPTQKLIAWSDVTLHPQIGNVRANPFLPEKLEIMPIAEEVTPTLIANDEFGQIYFAPDSRYYVPETAAILNFKTPLLDGSAKANVLIDLYLKAIKDKLSSTLFFANQANLNTNCQYQNMKLSLFVQGYSDKLPLLLKELFTASKQVHPTKEQFQIYKQSLNSAYDNASKELPIFQARETLSNLIFNDSPTNAEKLKIISTISYEEFIQFSSTLFEKTYIEGVFYGNLKENEAHNLWTSLKMTLAATPYPKDQQKNKTVLLLPQNHGPYMIVQNTERQGNAVLLLLEEGPFSLENRALQQLISKALQDAFFDTLRTKQQTAYIAKAWDSEVERQLLQFFAVQSSTHHPAELLARFELFLESFLKNIPEDIPEDRFETIKRMLITSLQMPPENMQGMALRLSTFAFDYEGDFDWINKRIASVESITYEQFITGAKTFLSRGNARRLAILVEGVLAEENDFHYERISKEDIHALGTFVTWR
ncbi:MAG: insulinase family protein [Chlamydiota bacterium]